MSAEASSPTKAQLVLLLAANPIDLEQLHLGREIREIRESLHRAGGGSWKLETIYAARSADLRHGILEHEPVIVHYCGHGTNSTGIIFENEQGQRKSVRAEALAKFFRLFSHSIKCVVLNACYTQQQANAIAQHIDYVIGMRDTVSDDAAIGFARSFYEAIASGKSFDFSYELAAAAVSLDEEFDFDAPCIIHRPLKESPNDTNSEVDKTRYDWSGAPDTNAFFGRTEEMTMLRDWILQDRCRLIMILGMRGIGKTRLSMRLSKGGIGKTDLSIHLAKGLTDAFDFIVWKKLLNAPPLEDLLRSLISFLSNQNDIAEFDESEEYIASFMRYLVHKRCLIILDNAESILRGKDNGGTYREGYESYGELLTQIGEIDHQSCVLITSREKLPEFSKMEGESRPVRVFHLRGLNIDDSKQIFRSIGKFRGNDEEWRDLVELYNGNPLALELTARHINEIFEGEIAEFIKYGRPVFGDLRDLLDWHFNRLTEAEQEVMYWLAINREPMTIKGLQEDIVDPRSKDLVPSTLQLLQRRLPLERSLQKFTLQPVLIEFMTDQLIEKIGKEFYIPSGGQKAFITEKLVEETAAEIVAGKLKLFNSHAMLKASSTVYVRESQRRLILRPVEDRMLTEFGTPDAVRTHIDALLEKIKAQYMRRVGYSAGNIINMLCDMGLDLSGYDFSRLTIWQAFLQGSTLHDVDFSYSEMVNTTFTETFGGILSVAVDPTSTYLAASGINGDIRIWRFSDGQPILDLRGHESWIWSIKFSSDGRYLASASNDCTSRIWNIPQGSTHMILRGHDDRVRAVLFSDDADIVITASDDRTIRLWSTRFLGSAN
jgi:archaellum biogenesis ATPase FlaH